MVDTNNCPVLQVSGVSYNGVGGLRINNQVTVAVGVSWVAPALGTGTSGPCCLGGNVAFSWYALSLPGVPSTPIGSGFAFFFDPSNNEQTIICAPNVGAEAQINWIPTTTVVGPSTTSALAVGYVQAAITCTSCQCNSMFCGVTGPGDYTGSVVKGANWQVYPARASASGMEAMALLRQASPANVTTIGFGLGPPDRVPSKVRASALHTDGFADFTHPKAIVYALEARDVHADAGYHSGFLVPGLHFAREAKVGSTDEFVYGDARQGVLEVHWPKDSVGKRAIIEVWREVDGQRVGSFTIGLLNIPAGEPGQVWL